MRREEVGRGAEEGGKREREDTGWKDPPPGETYLPRLGAFSESPAFQTRCAGAPETSRVLVHLLLISVAAYRQQWNVLQRKGQQVRATSQPRTEQSLSDVSSVLKSVLNAGRRRENCGSLHPTFTLSFP